MIRYILQRLFVMIPMVFGISFIVFILMYLTPGDVLSQARAIPDISEDFIRSLEEQFGLNEPWHTQYFLWLKNFVTFNFGESWTYRIPVVDMIADRIPYTLLLTGTALIISVIMAIPLGVLAAVYQNRLFDRLGSGFAYAGISIPEFFLALLALFFAAQTGLLPIGGRNATTHEFMSSWAGLQDILTHLILPATVLAIGSIAGMARIMRSNFLDHIHAGYVLTAKAKGLSQFQILFKHALRNALNPLISVLGYQFAFLLSGALLVENIMNYPGLGQLIYEALTRQDQYLVMASAIMSSVLLMLGNLAADILLAWMDPRIRIQNHS